jgi:hypothetical protein
MLMLMLMSYAFSTLYGYEATMKIRVPVQVPEEAVT